MNVAPLPPDLLRECPSPWQGVLSQKADLSSFIAQTWGSQEQFPETSRILQKKLQGLALLRRPNGGRQELIYVFQGNGALRLFGGGEPTEALPGYADKLGVDLRCLYRIHDGFVDLSDRMTGFAAVGDVRTLGQDIDGNQSEGFLKIFEVGSNCLGFDLSDPNGGAYTIWASDEDVEFVEDFWAELDEWLACQLEDYDDASR